MKRFFKYSILCAVAALSLAACTKDIITPDQSMLPQASELDVDISVDQETNYVTFTLNNKGMVPLWIFGSEKIDGQENKRFAYTTNGISLRFREAGEHSVEVKAYNAHGISQGSVVLTFTLDNSYVDPFDPAPYMQKLAGTWEWNRNVDGHFGCGAADSETGSDWWSASANEKEGMSLYDDLMSFTEGGEYTYDPGDGQVYVNYGSGYMPDYNPGDGEDYVAPIEGYTTTYHFERDWNDAGIEEIWLCFPEGTNLSYIPNAEALENPRYQLMEQTTRKVVLVHRTADISWRYEFVPQGTSESGGDEDKTEPWDATAENNLWLTANTSNVSFYFADDSWAQIADPEFTAGDNNYTIVIPEGIGSQQWQGQVAFNSLGIATSAGSYYDFQVVLNSTEDHPGVTVKLTQNDDDNNFYTESRVALIGGEDYVLQVSGMEGKDMPDLKLVLDFGGAVGGSTVTVKDVVIRKGAAPFDPLSPDNLWLTAATDDVGFYFADENWAQIANPEFTAGDNSYTIVIPEGTGSQQWQGQVTFNNTGIVTTAEKTYDFQLKITSDEDHPGITIKLTQQDDDDTFFFTDRHQVLAGEEFVYTMTAMPGVDLGNAKLVRDFGGGIGGSTVTVSDIILRESK